MSAPAPRWIPPFTEDEAACLYFSERSTGGLRLWAELVRPSPDVPIEAMMAVLEPILEQAKRKRALKMATEPDRMPAVLWPLPGTEEWQLPPWETDEQLERYMIRSETTLPRWHKKLAPVAD